MGINFCSLHFTVTRSPFGAQTWKQILLSVLVFFGFIFSPSVVLGSENSHVASYDASSSQYHTISDANQTGLDITGDLTIEAWVKLDSDPGTNVYTVVSKYSTGSDRSYLFDIGDTDYLRLVGTFGGVLSAEQVSWNPSVGQWYHVAVSYESSTGNVKFYVDGTQQGATQSAGSGGIYNGTSDFRIGGRTGLPNSYMDGNIDDVRIWSVVRTASEIVGNKGRELSGGETGLQGYWNFNATSTDATTNGNDLANNGSPSYDTAVPFLVSRSVATFEGNSSFSLLDGSQTGLDVTGDLTIESWVKLDSDPGTNVFTIVSKYSFGSDRSYLFDLGDTDQLRLVGTFGSVLSEEKVSWNPSVGQWYHVAVTYANSTGDVKFYVDGTQQGATQSAGSGGIYNGTSDFRIGGRTGSPHSYFDGNIDDVRVWSGVRSQAEVARDKDAELNGTETNLKGYWKFNGGGLDATSNNNDFILPTFTTE